jgi:hypothetical protein
MDSNSPSAAPGPRAVGVSDRWYSGGRAVDVPARVAAGMRRALVALRGEPAVTVRWGLGSSVRRPGVWWLHIGGIYAALSPTTPDVVEAATRAARRYRTVVSDDLNYRPSLWTAVAGPEQARRVNRRLAAWPMSCSATRRNSPPAWSFDGPGTNELSPGPALGAHSVHSGQCPDHGGHRGHDRAA